MILEKVFSCMRWVWEVGNFKLEGFFKIEKVVKFEERVLGIKGGDRILIELIMELVIIKLFKCLLLYCSKGLFFLED